MVLKDRKAAVTVVQAIIVVIVVIAAAGVGYYFLKDKNSHEDDVKEIGLGTTLKYDMNEKSSNSDNHYFGSFELCLIGQNADFFYMKDTVKLESGKQYSGIEESNNKTLLFTEISTYTFKDTEKMETIDGNVDVKVYVSEDEHSTTTYYVGIYQGFDILYGILFEYTTNDSVGSYALTEHNLVLQSPYTESSNIGKYYNYSVDVLELGVESSDTCVRTCVGDSVDGELIFSMKFANEDFEVTYDVSSNGVPVDFIDTGNTKVINTMDRTVTAEIWTGDYVIYQYGDRYNWNMDSTFYMVDEIPYMIEMSSDELSFTFMLIGSYS
jgi:hypothetical protein